VDAVAVVVECNLVQEMRINHVRRVNDRAVRRVTEGIADGGNVVAAPLCGAESLGNLLSHKVAEYLEFIAEIVINTGDLFPYVRRNVVASDELVTTIRSGEDSSFE